MNFFENQSVQKLISKHKKIPQSLSSQLDMFRGLSALIVLVAHCYVVFIAPLSHTAYSIVGLFAQGAVMVFFVLSGFLICKSITRNSTENSGFLAREYAIDRVDRLFPPLLFSLILVCLLWLLSPYFFQSGTNSFSVVSAFQPRSGFEVKFASVIGTIFFMNGFITDNISANSALWTLSFEIWYYVAAGALATTRGVMGALIVCAIMLTFGVMNKSFLVYSVIWFAGAFVAVLHNWRLEYFKFTKIISIFFYSASLLLAAYYIVDFTNYSSQEQINIKIVVAFNVFTGLAFATTLHLKVNSTHPMKSFMQRTADFSYTLYIIHFPVFLFVYGISQAHIKHNIYLSILVATVTCLVCIKASSVLAKRLETVKVFRSILARSSKKCN